jgi:hypothetical protein
VLSLRESLVHHQLLLREVALALHHQFKLDKGKILAKLNVRMFPDFLKEEIPPCAESDPDAFFTIDVDVNGELVSTPHYFNEVGAKKVCSDCPYIKECLIFAIETKQIGIWGGTTENERYNLKRTLRRKNFLPISVKK